MRADNPIYWANDSFEVLHEAVQAYQAGHNLTKGQLGALRVYFRKWMGQDWHGSEIAALRARIDHIWSRGDITTWLRLAAKQGIDPL
jgi:hypothetical protein